MERNGEREVKGERGEGEGRRQSIHVGGRKFVLKEIGGGIGSTYM